MKTKLKYKTNNIKNKLKLQFIKFANLKQILEIILQKIH